MGVELFLLDWRTANLDIGGHLHKVGLVRHVGKVTEQYAATHDALNAAAALPSPAAVLVARPVDYPLLDAASPPVSAHTVLGWDPGRTSVTDYGWDYLPVHGYVLRDAARDVYVLHELREGALQPVSAARAEEVGLVVEGRLVQRGQPRIVGCESVRRFLDGYAEAEVVFEDGRRDALIVRLAGGVPEAGWFVGKRPAEVDKSAG